MSKDSSKSGAKPAGMPTRKTPGRFGRRARAAETDHPLHHQPVLPGEGAAVAAPEDTAAAAQDAPAHKAVIPVRRRITWGPLAAVLYSFVLLEGVQQVVAPLILAVPFLLQGWSLQQMQDALNNSVTAQFFFFLIAEGLTFGGIWWFVRRRGSSLGAIGWRKLRLNDVGIAVLAYVCYFLIYAIVYSVSTKFLPSLNSGQQQDIGFAGAVGTGSLTLVFISLAILPPIAEETVFRGFMFSGLKTKLPVVLSAVITSAVFAAAHLEWGSGQALLWIAALDTFTLSLVLCYVRQRTGALWAGILVHALKNTVAFYELFIKHVH